jgi:L-ascorbate metabolism protein UlaG (beta-lactamase superfamily)
MDHAPQVSDPLIATMDATRVPMGMLAVWWLGQASFAVKGDVTCYFDPYLSVSPDPALRRLMPPPVRPEEVTNADYVFITHDHLDHLDPATAPPIARASPQARFVVPESLVDRLASVGVPRERITGGRVDEHMRLDRLAFATLPAAHELCPGDVCHYDFECDTEGRHRYVGYVITCNGVTLYHSGDTVVYRGLVERLRAQRIDLALLPINGRDWMREEANIVGNLSYREAADLAVAAGVDTVIPMHYGMFASNDERPGYFVDYLWSRYPGQKYKIMAQGERYIYVKSLP